ncbi:MAG TPA: hypothetical protein PLD10_24165, partial [Rhodopila sp.]|nr:hypothetical protein [Rhodopila sp.]
MLVTAQTTKSFLDSIGVNVHLSDTSSAYGNLPLVEQELKYLGVNQVRDNQPYDWSLGNYQTIA